MPPDEVFHPEPAPRRRQPAGRAIATMAVTLVAVLLLSADGLHQTALRQPFGWQRSTALTIMRPVRWVSHHTGLHLPRRALVALTERQEGGATTSELDTRTVETAPVTTAPVTTAPGTTEAAGGGRTTSTSTTTTTEPPPTYRTPTAEEPLRIWVGGDSLSGNLADALARALEGRPVQVTKEVEVGTGLARPDVYDWFTNLPKLLDEAHAEVVVINFGGNDDQPLQTPGHAWRVGSDEWRAEYQRRVALLLSSIVKEGRTVIWVGMPPVARDRLEAARLVMNEVARAEAKARAPLVRYLDPTPALSPDGTYVQYDGTTKLREDDGVHLTHAGAARVVPSLLQLFAQERHIG